jgi:hypothetical protein
MENSNDTIPTPITSGATDHPDAPQSGTAQAPPTPAGFFETPPAIAPPTPAGFYDAPPAPHLGPNGQPNPNNVYRATDEESTPEGAAAAIARREAQHPILSGIGRGAESLLQPVFHPIDTVENIVKQSLPPFQVYDSMKRAYPLIQAYENARSQGQSVWQSIAAANDHARKQDAAAQAIDKAMADYKKNPTQTTAKILTQVAGTVAMLAAGGSGATAEAETPAIAPTAETAPAAEATEAAETSKLTNPVESAVNKGMKNSKLTEGSPAESLSEPDRAALIAKQDVIPTLRNSVGNIAHNEGLNPIADDVSVRDIANKLGDQFYARSKDMFAKVQKVTGVDLDDLNTKIQTLSDKIEDAVDDPEKAGRLEQQQRALQVKAEDAFDKAKENGLDVDQAKSDWKKYNASYDLGKQIRMSTTGRAGISAETVDLDKLSPRLHKLYDSNSPTQLGRLQQLAGDQEATSLLSRVDTHQLATQTIKDYVPQTATGTEALREVIRRNTIAKPSLFPFGKTSAVTNWNDVVKDLGNLSPEELTQKFGDEVPQVRQYVNSQAARQNAIDFLKGKTLGGKIAYGLAGTAGEELWRRANQ